MIYFVIRTTQKTLPYFKCTSTCKKILIRISGTLNFYHIRLDSEAVSPLMLALVSTQKGVTRLASIGPCGPSVNRLRVSYLFYVTYFFNILFKFIDLTDIPAYRGFSV